MTAFSISEFLAFCEGKPADEKYHYTAPDACALAQYHALIGAEYIVGHADPEGDDLDRAEWCAVWRDVEGGETTFGALAKRLRELEAAS